MHFTRSQHHYDAFRIYVDFTLDSQNSQKRTRLYTFIRSAALFFQLTTFLFSCQSFSDIYENVLIDITSPEKDINIVYCLKK